MTRVFQEAKFQDWENFLYIEPAIISKAMSWLVQHQDNNTGAFFETSNYSVPLDPKIDPKVPGQDTALVIGRRWYGMGTLRTPRDSWR